MEIMHEIKHEDYLNSIQSQKEVVFEGVQVPLKGCSYPSKLEPDEFALETTTAWSFEQRGNWATHKASYRGNWAPQIVRNVILRYSAPRELVLDQMVGGGTTLVECKLLGRTAIGVDVNSDAIILTRDRLNFRLDTLFAETPEPEIRTYVGDARNLNLIDANSIDLIATHPPYANIIGYSKNSSTEVNGDLSKVKDIAQFVEHMKAVASESFRVLRPGRYCAILIGDTRRNKHYVPIAFRVMQAFLDAGFILKEDVIKYQWHTKTEGLWARMSREKNFLLIMHEHLFIFRKPEEDEKLRKYRESMKW